jgi:sec-independent protein translocase protein TatB
VRKARTLSREFHSSVDQMIREAELEEVRQELKKATEFDIENEIKQTVDPTGSLAESIRPPNLPDYFEEPGAAALAPSEPAPALPAPAETPLTDRQAAAAETEPQLTLPGMPEPPSGAPEASSGPAPAPPKPAG